MTRADVLAHAQTRYAQLARISEHAAEEAREQAGLPEVWAWDRLTVRAAEKLSVACAIRLYEL